jgi:hypothetical protein
MDSAPASTLHLVSWVTVVVGVVVGLASCVFVAWDMGHRQPQEMAVMRYVWPINALWGGVVIVGLYWKIGRMPATVASQSSPAQKAATKERPFWQKVAAGTFHCGADVRWPTWSVRFSFASCHLWC